MSTEIVTQARLKEMFEYDPDTGNFIRKISTSHNARFGDIAGTLSHGYVQISIDHRCYRAHRLVWRYVHGNWPEEIDHINGIRSDNRIENLRDVKLRSKNNQNLPLSKANKSGTMGVFWNEKRQKWWAYIHVGGKRIDLGHHKDYRLAVIERYKAEIKYGFHANHGRIIQKLSR